MSKKKTIKLTCTRLHKIISKTHKQKTIQNTSNHRMYLIINTIG